MPASEASFFFDTPLVQGRKNSININFLVRISRGHPWPLHPDGKGSKSFSPPPGPQENALFGADVHDFRRGCPWPEGFLENFVQIKFALIFWPLLGNLCFFQERGRSRVPEPPRLRVLNQDPADIPIPEGSLVPNGSPTNGQLRAHPYTPVGNAVGSSSFEFEFFRVI